MSKGVHCSPRTHRQTDTHKSKYRGHPFRVSGIFPSTYHLGLVQYDKTGTIFVFVSQSIVNEYLLNFHFRMPAYDQNKWFFLFFFVYLILCLYIFMSIVLATIYNNYKTNLKVSMFVVLSIEGIWYLLKIQSQYLLAK